MPVTGVEQALNMSNRPDWSGVAPGDGVDPLGGGETSGVAPGDATGVAQAFWDVVLCGEGVWLVAPAILFPPMMKTAIATIT